MELPWSQGQGYGAMGCAVMGMGVEVESPMGWRGWGLPWVPHHGDKVKESSATCMIFR